MSNNARRTICVLALLAAALADFLWINPANQTYAKDYLNESIALSVGTYATCRIINGGVSSIQESSINISPWGIGLQYEAGQILDPINDATERLSDACVKSMALLGVQRLLLTAINAYTIVPFYVSLALFLLCSSLSKTTGLTVSLGRCALFLLLLRVSTPVMCLIGTAVNENYFTPHVAEEQERLARVKEIAMVEFEAEVPSLVSVNRPAENKLDAVAQFFLDFRDRIVSLSAALSHRTTALSKAVVYLKDNFADISASLANLFVLVIEKVIVQVLLVPLGVLLVLKKTYTWLSEERFEKGVARIMERRR